MGADGPITPVLAGAMCCYFNAVRVVDGIGNLRTPRLQSEAEPQKTMRLPIEFGLYPKFGHFEPVWAYRPGVYINYPRSFAVGCMGIVRLSVATPRVVDQVTRIIPTWTHECPQFCNWRSIWKSLPQPFHLLHSSNSELP